MQSEPTERQRRYREEYLSSPHWRETRKAALARAGNRCQVCNGAKSLDVHHRTYERLGQENPEDLTVLCRICHNLFHASGLRLVRSQKAARPGVNRAKIADILGVLSPGEVYTTRQIAALAGVHQASATGACGQLVKKGLLVRISKKRFALASPNGNAC